MIVNSLTELLSKSNEVIMRAHRAGQSVWLIVPSHTWAQQRKMQLRHTAPVGINILTLPQFVEQMWDLYGDGTKIITPMQRKVLLRPLIEQVGLLEASASPKLVDALGAFVSQAVGSVDPNAEPVFIGPGQGRVNMRTASLDADPVPSHMDPLLADTMFSASESRILELLNLYERKLELEGLKETVQAQRELLSLGAGGRKRYVFENPDLHNVHTRDLLMGLEHFSRVHIFKQCLAPGSSVGKDQDPSELSELHQRLYTGQGGLAGTGKVHVGIAQGAHAAPAVITRLVQEVHGSNAVPYEDIVVCVGSLTQDHQGLFDALASASVPFAARISMPCAKVGLGAAFHQLEQLSQSSSDDRSFTALVDLACGPYSGVPAQDARALQMRWRERAHSTAEERLQDVMQGFDQGNANAALTKERLAPLAALINASREERVHLLFEHAHGSHLDVDVLLDDRVAAEALLDYLEVCKSFSAAPDMNEMANLPIVLSRGYGDQSHAVSIVSAHDIGPAAVGAVILCDLDSVHYPMASQNGPFDALMSKLGIDRADTLADDQRLMLLDLLGLSKDAFAFMRSTHDASGDESCQSALFEELLAAYRSSPEDSSGLPVHAVPSALDPWCISLSEADLFFGSTEKGEERTVARGFLELPGSIHDLVLDAKGEPLLFSPTALEDYYRCPYRWFTNRRVGYNGMDTRFDPASQGNLVHAVMERFYTELMQTGRHRVTPDDLEFALELASNAFDRQLELEKGRERRGLYVRTRLDECICEDLRAQVLAFVERDSQFLPGFAPRYLELSLGTGSVCKLQYAGVPVRGKVDRIDVDQNGNAVIIDYKLSGLASGYGLGKQAGIPDRIQTDIYATLVQRHFSALGEPIKVIGSVYRSYSKNYLRGSYASGIDWGPIEATRQELDALPRKDLPISYEEYLLQVEDRVAECVSQLKGGHIAPDPIAADVCQYCKALAFCPKGGA